MSVSLKEVLESAGYDLTSIDDAKWLVSKVTEFETLIEEAENLVEEEQDRIDAEVAELENGL